MHMHMRMHACMHAYACAYAYANAYACAYAYAYACTCICMCMYMQGICRAYAVHAYNHPYPLPSGVFEIDLWAFYFSFADLPCGVFRIYLFAFGPHSVLKGKVNRHVCIYIYI